MNFDNHMENMYDRLNSKINTIGGDTVYSEKLNFMSSSSKSKFKPIYLLLLSPIIIIILLCTFRPKFILTETEKGTKINFKRVIFFTVFIFGLFGMMFLVYKKFIQK